MSPRKGAERTPEAEPKVKLYELNLKLTIEATSMDEARVRLAAKIGEVFGVELISTQIRKFCKSEYAEAVKRVKKRQYATRAERLGEAQDAISDAKAIVEDLTSELQDWRDNLPENLQNGSKADELGEAISQLEAVAEALDNAEDEAGNVCFPGMM